eukprot:gnl/Dysnectes_brevis/2076_a2404_1015.p1 GENE.gnl/Dysnectes_brevis/2076_a2404_1015~~gnl/Dysnectes_brevis/2076_a2404_1015.p1  ORF type:complete len:1373 (-),score=427.63 gnl/Dysnectes_brevis/2076_a2404_1015:137-4255(-)
MIELAKRTKTRKQKHHRSFFFDIEMSLVRRSSKACIKRRDFSPRHLLDLNRDYAVLFNVEDHTAMRKKLLRKCRASSIPVYLYDQIATDIELAKQSDSSGSYRSIFVVVKNLDATINTTLLKDIDYSIIVEGAFETFLSRLTDATEVMFYAASNTLSVPINLISTRFRSLLQRSQPQPKNEGYVQSLFLEVQDWSHRYKPKCLDVFEIDSGLPFSMIVPHTFLDRECRTYEPIQSLPELCDDPTNPWFYINDSRPEYNKPPSPLPLGRMLIRGDCRTHSQCPIQQGMPLVRTATELSKRYREREVLLGKAANLLLGYYHQAIETARGTAETIYELIRRMRGNKKASIKPGDFTTDPETIERERIDRPERTAPAGSVVDPRWIMDADEQSCLLPYRKGQAVQLPLAAYSMDPHARGSRKAYSRAGDRDRSRTGRGGKGSARGRSSARLAASASAASASAAAGTTPSAPSGDVIIIRVGSTGEVLRVCQPGRVLTSWDSVQLLAKLMEDPQATPHRRSRVNPTNNREKFLRMRVEEDRTGGKCAVCGSDFDSYRSHIRSPEHRDRYHRQLQSYHLLNPLRQASKTFERRQAVNAQLSRLATTIAAETRQRYELSAQSVNEAVRAADMDCRMDIHDLPRASSPTVRRRDFQRWRESVLSSRQLNLEGLLTGAGCRRSAFKRIKGTSTVAMLTSSAQMKERIRYLKLQKLGHPNVPVKAGQGKPVEGTGQVMFQGPSEAPLRSGADVLVCQELPEEFRSGPREEHPGSILIAADQAGTGSPPPAERVFPYEPTDDVNRRIRDQARSELRLKFEPHDGGEFQIALDAEEDAVMKNPHPETEEATTTARAAHPQHLHAKDEPMDGADADEDAAAATPAKPRALRPEQLKSDLLRVELGARPAAAGAIQQMANRVEQALGHAAENERMTARAESRTLVRDSMGSRGGHSHSHGHGHGHGHSEHMKSWRQEIPTLYSCPNGSVVPDPVGDMLAPPWDAEPSAPVPAGADLLLPQSDRMQSQGEDDLIPSAIADQAVLARLLRVPCDVAQNAISGQQRLLELSVTPEQVFSKGNGTTHPQEFDSRDMCVCPLTLIGGSHSPGRDSSMSLHSSSDAEFERPASLEPIGADLCRQPRPRSNSIPGPAILGPDCISARMADEERTGIHSSCPPPPVPPSSAEEEENVLRDAEWVLRGNALDGSRPDSDLPPLDAKKTGEKITETLHNVKDTEVASIYASMVTNYAGSEKYLNVASEFWQAIADSFIGTAASSIEGSKEWVKTMDPAALGVMSLSARGRLWRQLSAEALSRPSRYLPTSRTVLRALPRPPLFEPSSSYVESDPDMLLTAGDADITLKEKASMSMQQVRLKQGNPKAAMPPANLYN